MRLPSAERPDVTILVVLTADAQRAQACLGAIAEGVGDRACEVVVVLNGAPPDVRAIVAAGARVVDAVVDLGAGHAWRAGLAIARAPRVALLHEDSAPQAGWLEPLLGALDAHPHAALAGSRLLWPDGRHQNDGWVIWDDGHVTVLRDELAAHAGAGPRPVDYVSSASLVAERAVLAALELPDERWFPAVYTDTDISMSAWAAGHTVLHVPASVVVHAKHAMVQAGGQPDRNRYLPEFLYERNRERFVEKWSSVLATHATRPAETFPDAVGPDALRAALARTAERATVIEGAPPAVVVPAPVPADPRGLLSEHELEAARERRRALQGEMMTWLAERLERAEQDVGELAAIVEARNRDQATAADGVQNLEAELARTQQANAELHEELRRVHAEVRRLVG